MSVLGRKIFQTTLAFVVAFAVTFSPYTQAFASPAVDEGFSNDLPYSGRELVSNSRSLPRSPDYFKPYSSVLSLQNFETTASGRSDSRLHSSNSSSNEVDPVLQGFPYSESYIDLLASDEDVLLLSSGFNIRVPGLWAKQKIVLTNHRLS